jgi:hypothetical protein
MGVGVTRLTFKPLDLPEAYFWALWDGGKWGGGLPR